MKTCTKCQAQKPLAAFYSYQSKPASKCKDCHKEAARARHHADPEAARTRAARWRRDNPDWQKAHSKARRTHDKGRSTILLASAKRRAKLAGTEFALDRNWVLKELAKGVCPLTGWKFRLNDDTGGKRYDPLSPSIDRLDPSLGYTPDNCRVVCSIANMARGEMSDAELLDLAQALVKTISSRAPQGEGSTTIPKGSRGKRPEAPNTLN